MDLVIGDLHIDSQRVKAIKTAIASLEATIKGTKYTSIKVLGDVFNEYPNIEERVLFADFINLLKKYTEEIILIKGTKFHDYSKGIYNLEDIIRLTNIQAVDILKEKKSQFVHEDIVGLKYSSGHVTEHGMEVDGKLTTYAGHYHSPCEDKEKNIYVVGSIYKTDFSEVNDTKRIIARDEKKVKSYAIESRPMYQWNLIGKQGKLIFKDLAIYKGLPEQSELDLKLIIDTDSVSLSKMHESIDKIKSKFNIEYYQQEINVTEIKVNIPKNLKQEALLENYCQEKNIPYDLVRKEL